MADSSQHRPRHRGCIINELHDPILTHILSFLPIKEAVRCGVLSKRWSTLHKTIPGVEFNDEEFPSHTEFFGAISKFIVSHQGNLRSFRIRLTLESDEDRKFLGKLLMYVASVKNVEDLRVCTFPGDKPDECYDIPFHKDVVVCQSIRNLELTGCGFHFNHALPPFFCFLKSLTLESIRFGGHHLSCMLCACPQLEILNVIGCESNDNDFVIFPPNLRKLKIAGSTFLNVHVEAPNLEYFDFGCRPECCLGGSGDGDDDDAATRCMNSIFLDKCQIKTLKVCTCILKVGLLDNSPEVLHAELSNLELMVIRGCRKALIIEYDLAFLLKLTPKLRTLHIERFDSLYSWEWEFDVELAGFQFDRLENVSIGYFYGSADSLTLVRMILDTSPSLKSMTITLCSPEQSWMMFEELKNLLRTYPHVKMILLRV